MLYLGNHLSYQQEVSQNINALNEKGKNITKQKTKTKTKQNKINKQTNKTAIQLHFALLHHIMVTKY